MGSITKPLFLVESSSDLCLELNLRALLTKSDLGFHQQTCSLFFTHSNVSKPLPVAKLLPVQMWVGWKVRLEGGCAVPSPFSGRTTAGKQPQDQIPISFRTFKDMNLNRLKKPLKKSIFLGVKGGSLRIFWWSLKEKNDFFRASHIYNIAVPNRMLICKETD